MTAIAEVDYRLTLGDDALFDLEETARMLGKSSSWLSKRTGVGERPVDKRDYHREELEAISAKLGLAHRLKLKDLRRSFGTLVVENTKSLHAAKGALRHASVVTTERHYVSLQAQGAIEAAVAIAPKMSAWLQRRSDSPANPIRQQSRKTQEKQEENMVSAEGVEPTTNGLRVRGHRENIGLSDSPASQSAQVIAGDFRPQPLQSRLQSARALLASCGGDLDAAIHVLRRAAKVGGVA